MVMSPKSGVYSVAAAAMVLLCHSPARADVAFNNFGAGDIYDASSGSVLGGLQAQFPVTQGFRFTAAASGEITRLVVPVQYLSGGDQLAFQIHADGVNPFGTDPIPGGLLGVLGQVTAFDLTLPPPPPAQLDAVGSVRLTSGTVYWLVGRGVGDASGVWLHNAAGTEGARARQRPGEAWLADVSPVSAFRIEVTAGAGCPGDLDGNGLVQPADVALFVNVWFTSLNEFTRNGDYDGNGAVEPADVARFVAMWFAGVLGGC